MKKIITISREFGSGGREFAKRLADYLNLQYIDNEIITEMANETKLNSDFLTEKLEKGLVNYPITYAHSFSSIALLNTSVSLLALQHNIIKKIAAKTECIIVGRGADAILDVYHPYKIFIYADMESKINRCIKRMNNGEFYSRKQLEHQIKSIDKNRKNTHNLYSNYAWGDKEGYHLCINTSNINICDIVPLIGELIKKYFEEN